MAVVVERDVEGPATHALIIGVGDYPHVGAGAAEPLVRALGSLSSPPISAVALARFLAGEEFADARAPLGSIELLACGPADYGDWRPGVPTRAEIQKAFLRWFKRGDSDPGNVLLFFFCGHGLQRAGPVVLPSDFGSDELNPLARAIDLLQTRLGTARCKARTQLWLVDACREAPAHLLAMVGTIGTALAMPTAQGQQELDSTMIASTTDFRLASGLAGQPSRFTAALLAALRGVAAEPDENGSGKWSIRTGRLQYAINALLREESEENRWPEQQCESLSGTGNGILRSLAAPPPVPVRVSCDPAVNLARVALYIRNELTEQRRPPKPTPWQISVPAGIYRVGAEPEPAAGMVSARETLSFCAPPCARTVIRW